MHTIATHEQLGAAVAGLIAIEPLFAKVVEAHGLPPLRAMDGGLAGLLRIVTDQMISLRAGQAIWRRLAAELHPFDPVQLMGLEISSYMRIGLSAAKARLLTSRQQAETQPALSVTKRASSVVLSSTRGTPRPVASSTSRTPK